MPEALTVLIAIVQEAGKAILDLQKTNFSIAAKANGDIVTQADLLANDILYRGLSKAFPDYGWLSEESVDAPTRLTQDYVWIVDPIDGTKEYAANRAEYAISVALIEKQVPIVAVVFNPATDELFYAAKNQGANLVEKSINKKINCLNSMNDQLVLLASRSEYSRGDWDRFKHYRIEQSGSIAYKMALVAAGKATATWSLGFKNEWDIAAGTLLVTEAGGIVTDKVGLPFKFNQEQVRVNGVIACAAKDYETVCKLTSS